MALPALLLAVASPAQAFFGCDIVAADGRAAPLFAGPDLKAEVVAMLPHGDIVGMLDPEPETVIYPEGWYRVSWNPEQTSMLSENDTFGWMRLDVMGECG